MLGLRLAVADLDLERRDLVDALLVAEVTRSIRRTFARHPHRPATAAGLFSGWLAGCPVAAASGAGVAGQTTRVRRRRGCCGDCDIDCCDCCDADCCSGCDCDCCSGCNCDCCSCCDCDCGNC